MNQKLTLSLDSSVIAFANDFSKKVHKPISKIIESYFQELRSIDVPDLQEEFAELRGILKGINLPDKKEMRKIFHEDHIN